MYCVLQLFYFLCCILFFLLLLCLSSFCTRCVLCCQWLWIVHSWLSLRFSLTFSLSIFITKTSLRTYYTRNRVWITPSPVHCNRMRSPLISSRVSDVRSVVFCVVLFRSLLAPLSILYSQWCCLSFFDLCLLVAPLLSSNASYFSLSATFFCLYILLFVSLFS